MRCRNCEKELRENCNYCSDCGSKVEGKEIEVINFYTNKRSVNEASKLSALCYIPFGFLAVLGIVNKDNRMKKAIVQGIVLSFLSLVVLFLLFLILYKLNSYNWLDRTFIENLYNTNDYLTMIKFSMYSLLILMLILYIPINSTIGVLVSILTDKHFRILIFGFLFK